MDEASQVPLIEAARLLQVSYHVALRWCLVGELVAERRDGRWLVNRQSVSRMQRERAEGTRRRRPPTPAR